MRVAGMSLQGCSYGLAAAPLCACYQAAGAVIARVIAGTGQYMVAQRCGTFEDQAVLGETDHE
jgi:hypothetical protein